MDLSSSDRVWWNQKRVLMIMIYYTLLFSKSNLLTSTSSPYHLLIGTLGMIRWLEDWSGLGWRQVFAVNIKLPPCCSTATIDYSCYKNTHYYWLRNCHLCLILLFCNLPCLPKVSAPTLSIPESIQLDLQIKKMLYLLLCITYTVYYYLSRSSQSAVHHDHNMSGSILSSWRSS